MSYMTKDEIFETAMEEFGVALDLTKKHAALMHELENLRRNGGLAPEPEPMKERAPKRVRNIKTGNEFGWNPLFKGNPDLEIIEWSD